MKIRIVFLMALVIVFISCKKDNNEMPEIPEGIGIDMNSDGIEDFKINYSIATVFSDTADEVIYCFLEILGENELLYHEDAPFLFLRNPEVIKENMNSPYDWKRIDGIITSLPNRFDGGWASTWDIESDEDRDSYFIGVQLNSTDSIDIGWIELEVDNRTGIVTIKETVVL